MALSLKTAAGWLSDQAAAAQTSAAAVLDLTVGSPIRAIFEATATVALWLQAQVVSVAASMRLASAVGSDVDSWLADFGLIRLPATPATGFVTLSRFVTNGSATVQVGWTVRTTDLSQTYLITANTTSAYWDATVGTAGGYVIPVGVSGIDVPVTAQVAGSVGNVIAGAIDLAGTAMPGIDTVSNAATTTGGTDAESDAAFKARFPLYIASLDRGTDLAIQSAIAGVQEGLTYLVEENVNEAAQFTPGHFVVTVDDGSGNPSAALKASVYTAVDAVRPITSTFSVQSPIVDWVNVALTLTVGAGSTKAALLAPVQNAIANYINALPVGSTLSITRIAALAYGVSPTISNVSGVSINGSGSDLVAGATAVVKTQTVTVS